MILTAPKPYQIKSLTCFLYDNFHLKTVKIKLGCGAKSNLDDSGLIPEVRRNKLILMSHDE
jgi:hypothetical protein